MAVVDGLVLGTLAIGLILGLMRGFLSQVIGLIGLVGGGYLAWRYSDLVREQAIDPFINSEHNGKIAFGLVLFVALIVVALIGWVLRKLFQKLEIGAYDRLMGGIFGAVKAALVCAGVLLVVVALAHDGGSIERAIGTSRMGPALWDGMGRVAGILPKEVRTDVRDFLMRHSLPRDEEKRGE